MTEPIFHIKEQEQQHGKIPMLNIDKGNNLFDCKLSCCTKSHETLQFGESELNVSTYSFEDIQIIFFRGAVYQDIDIPIRDSGEYLSLAFVKDGTITTKSKRCNYEYVAEPGTANLCLHCSFEGSAHFAPTNNLEIVSICLPISYLNELNSLIEHCDSYRAHGYMHIAMNNNLAMQECINMLLAPPVKGNLKQVFLKGKAFELLSLSIQSMFAQPLPSDNVNDKEKCRVYHARDILDKSLLNPPKLKNLARLVGTNECKLKKDFKIVFNTSPYAYVIKRRMEKAYQHIISSDMAITTIAQNLGYNNASHFSSTFYKHYGVKPRELKHLRKHC